MSSEGPADSAAVARRLSAFRVMAGMSLRAVRQVARMGSWLCLPGGMELQREGAHDRALFFILSGTMNVHIDNGHGALECIAHVPAGETVGEMSLLSDEPHSARLIAHRDCEIFVLRRDAFERFTAHHPQFLRNLSLLLIERLRRTTSRLSLRPRCRAITLLGERDPSVLHEVKDRLLPLLRELGLTVEWLDSRHQGRSAEWYQDVEARHDMLLYLVNDQEEGWRRQAERQADKLILVGADKAGLSKAAPGSNRKPDDVLVWSDGEVALTSNPPAPVTGLRHLVRKGVRGDMERLARHLAGRSVGLVLSGGGARGFAHAGVYRALNEAGVPVDAVGGTSMGAIIAAGIALEWGVAELTHRLKDAFVTTNPISDLTVPTISFFGGRKVRRLLNNHFGGVLIEELALPYFCITSDLTAGADVAHKSGLLAERLAASVALPGLLPPVVINEHIHVDGGVMNNLPVDHMARLCFGSIIAVDVCGDTSLGTARGTIPGILAILARSGTVGNEWQRREARRQARILIEPGVSSIGFRDWAQFELAAQIGYETTCRQMEAAPEHFIDLFTHKKQSAA